MAEILTMREVIEDCERTVIQAEMLRFTDTKQYMEHKQVREWLEELQHYKDLEEQGRLIELPCKIGDTVYSFSFNIVYPFTVNGFEINKYGVEFKGSYCGEEKSLEYWSIHFPVSKIGKSVFLTREEAEAALNEVDE